MGSLLRTGVGWGAVGGVCLLWGVNQCQALPACRLNPAGAQSSAIRGLAPRALWKDTWKRCIPMVAEVALVPWDCGAWILPHRSGTGSLPYPERPPTCLPPMVVFPGFLVPAPAEGDFFQKSSVLWMLWGWDLGSLWCHRLLGSHTLLPTHAGAGGWQNGVGIFLGIPD